MTSTVADPHAPSHDAHGHAPHGDHGHHVEESFFKKYFFSTDHKIIGFQYLFTGMAMALIGGFTVYVFRMQQAFPGMDVPGWGRVSAHDYNSLVTTHGSVMIFWVAMPVLIAAFGNYLIPLSKNSWYDRRLIRGNTMSSQPIISGMR